MPRSRAPHLHRETTRHGSAAWYVRIGKGSRTRIRAEFGTAEFDAEYQAAISGAPRRKKGAPSVGTLAWLLTRYRETTDWATLSAATRGQRDNIFVHVLDAAGHQPYTKVTTNHIHA